MIETKIFEPENKQAACKCHFMRNAYDVLSTFPDDSII